MRWQNKSSYTHGKNWRSCRLRETKESLLLPAFYLQRIIDIFCMFAYVLYLLLLSLDMCELFCLCIFVFYYCKQWRSQDLKKSGIR